MGRSPDVPPESVLKKIPRFRSIEHIKALIDTQALLRRIGEKK